MADKKQQATWKVLFSGRVQGVGFRYFVNQTVSDYPIVGHVCNLPDGSVEMVAIGCPSILDQVVQLVRLHSPGHVDSVYINRSWDSPIEYDAFSIRR